MFLESIHSEATREAYVSLVNHFLKYYKLDDFDSLTRIEKNELQKMVETYTIHLKKKISPNTMKTYLNPIKSFLEINDIDLNWSKIKRLYPTKVKTSGTTAYSSADVRKMLGDCRV